MHNFLITGCTGSGSETIEIVCSTQGETIEELKD